MKLHTIIALFMLTSLHQLNGFRRSRNIRPYPATPAEQLMRNYTPQPYSLERGRYARRFERGWYPVEGDPVVGIAQDPLLTGATNQPEHLGID